MNDKPVIHVIDDDAAMRDSLAFLLDVNGYRSRVYETADAFLAGGGAEVSSCVVVSDIRMPGISGIELVRKLKREAAASAVILITGHGDVALAVEAMKAGAADFIEKPFDDAALLDAIRAALDTRPSAAGENSARKQAAARLADLSPRERDVLQGVVAGKINKVIAHELSISPRTVEVYRANLMAKTAARSMSELMRLALAVGL